MSMRTIRTIGRGGFGQVEEVADQYDQIFARKTFSVFQAGFYTDDLIENVKQRFVREAKVQASLIHPNIMPVMWSCLDLDPPCFGMPVAAASLADDLLFDRQLGGAALKAIMDVLAGLEELHGLGIYHRDLKPQNVMRLSDEHGDRYVIGDFGLMALRDTQITVLTQTGMQMRSDLYTAPEIVTELRRATHASDIYSVGCILHDMFRDGPDRIPCAEVTDDRGPFAEIIRICTRRDPTRRFPNVAALRDAILSVDLTGAVAGERQVGDFVELLNSDNAISVDLWEEICQKLSQIYPSPDAQILLAQIPAARIGEVVESNPQAAIGICEVYCTWVKDTSFDFNLCDGIANRLEKFLPLDDVSSKVEIRLALLELGASHNRWYVEKKFVALCGPGMDSQTARRMGMELRVWGAQACRRIAQLEASIDYDRGNLHSTLVSTLNQVCK